MSGGERSRDPPVGNALVWQPGGSGEDGPGARTGGACADAGPGGALWAAARGARGAVLARTALPIPSAKARAGPAPGTSVRLPGGHRNEKGDPIFPLVNTSAVTRDMFP